MFDEVGCKAAGQQNNQSELFHEN